MINIIVAMSLNSVIGIDNSLPWHIPEDLKYFKQTTMNHTVVMGRKTFESIGKLLPNRKNIILTRNKEYNVPGAYTVDNVRDCLSMLPDTEEVFIIGGEEIYKEFLPYVDKLYITHIPMIIDCGDLKVKCSKFPNYEDDFKCIKQEVKLTHTNNMSLTFSQWQRK